jgi:WD40 repeat protein
MIVTSEGVVADKIREDAEKIQIVMQYLESRGLMKTLAQMEEETGSTYISSLLGEGGILDTLVDARTRATGTPSVEESESLPIAGECATKVACIKQGIHGSTNPTSVAWVQSSDMSILTGGVDGKIHQWKWDGEDGLIQEPHTLTVPSPVLFLDTSVDGHVAAACMGGEVCLFSNRNEMTAVNVSRPHGVNRVTCALFSPNGKMLATFGRDIAVSVMALIDSGEWAEVSGVTIRYEREISSICWIAEDTIAVAETGNCMVGLYKIMDGKKTLIGEMCMNKSTRDPRSNYSMLAMAWHDELRLLAGCTSRNSAVLFQLPKTIDDKKAVCPIKTYYGMSLGVYDFPSIMFSVDGSFLYVTSDKEIIVFETKTCHKVFSISGSESKPVRCVSRHHPSDTLATVSFDKSLYVIS